MAHKTYLINNVKAVILVGARDFGRCPTATRLNRALWPVAGKAVLHHLIEHISNQGVRRFVFCCENSAEQIRQSLDFPAYLDVSFIEETMPRGTAGCIRDAAEPGSDELLFVFQACSLFPPDIYEMIQAHRRGNSEMTIFFNPDDSNDEFFCDAQLYICEPSILGYIPQKGYFDIKEGLVPVLVTAHKAIYAAELTKPSGTFTRWQQYLCAVSMFLDKIQKTQSAPSGFFLLKSFNDIWTGKNVQISESARLCGPVLIDSGSIVEPDTVILGPTLIGKNVIIGHNSCIDQTVIWDNVDIGRNCRIRQSLIDTQQKIPAGVQLDGQLVPQSQRFLASCLTRIQLRLKHPVKKMTKTKDRYKTLAEHLRTPHLKWTLVIMTLLLMGGIIVSYWRPTVIQLWHIWLESDEYSSGLLVPFLAAYVLWIRRNRFLNSRFKPAWTGLSFLLVAQAFRLFGLYFMFASAERLALVLSIGGIILLLYGWAIFRQFATTFVFLFLMLPLPNRVELMVTLPLQQWATVSAVYSLETLGYNVIRQGNIIQIGETMVAIAEACNGLRMLTAFFVISGFVVLISQRKRGEKIILLLSAIPIALICNTLRLTLTSIAFTLVHTETLEVLFHDFGGLAMMPLAIGLIIFEMWFLKHLFYKPETIEHQVVFSRSIS